MVAVNQISKTIEKKTTQNIYIYILGLLKIFLVCAKICLSKNDLKTTQVYDCLEMSSTCMHLTSGRNANNGLCRYLNFIFRCYIFIIIITRYYFCSRWANTVKFVAHIHSCQHLRGNCTWTYSQILTYTLTVSIKIIVLKDKISTLTVLANEPQDVVRRWRYRLRYRWHSVGGSHTSDIHVSNYCLCVTETVDNSCNQITFKVQTLIAGRYTLNLTWKTT